MMKLLFPLLTFCFLSFPLLTEVVAPQWDQLGGVSKERKQPKLSLETFSSGKFQARFEKWFINTLGIRTPLVKTDNQLNYSIFSQLFSSTKGKAILGNDGHLIEKSYLLRAQGVLYPKKKVLKERIRELKALSELLTSQGKSLIILISANKPALYPELIPSLYRVDDSFKNPEAPLPFLIEKLNAAGVPVIDGPAVLRRHAVNFEDSFFAPTGTHWNELGACLIVSELAQTISKIDSTFSGSLKCDVDGKRQTPLQMDRDLLSVANLWFPKKLIKPTPKVVRNFTPHPENSRERILFVGTSFLWSLFHHLDKAPFFSHRDMYYYFKRSVPFPRGKVTPIKRKESRWITRALKSKYIVLEVNEGFIHRLGHGFPKRVLEQGQS